MRTSDTRFFTIKSVYWHRWIQCNYNSCLLFDSVNACLLVKDGEKMFWNQQLQIKLSAEMRENVYAWRCGVVAEKC